MDASDGRWVGKPVERFEDPALLRGEARFIDDLSPVAGLCHAAILRSPHGHAEIARLDTSAAEALPGVISVLTGAQIASLSKPMANLVTRGIDFYPCAVRKVRYFGEPVAVVVAQNRYIAEDALDLIEVSYKPLPAVVSICEVRSGLSAGKLHADGDLWGHRPLRPWLRRVHSLVEFPGAVCSAPHHV
jgi:2-furoyl-CoA dehydrogenase large subunit